MIGQTARAATIAAFERRLADLGPIGAMPPTRPAAGTDPEEALRQLMVHHLPSAGALTANQRAQVCELFVEIADASRTADVRYLDAFNVWFEAVNEDGAWSREPRWRMVHGLHAAALLAAIARLEGARETQPTAVDAEAERVGATDTAGSVRGHARVLVLADNWIAGFRIWREVSRVEGVRVRCLICNNASARWLQFALRQASAAVATGAAGALALGLALVRHGVKFSAHRLHDDAVIRWIRGQHFSIGLHAMGVIYRNSALGAFERGVLNAHIGLLPEYRGRSVMEWSILAGAPTGITVFFMDAGIDTGRDIVLRRTVDISGAHVPAAKASLFHRDGDMYAEALRRLLGAPDAPLHENVGGRRYYVMSRLLTSVVESLLTRDQSGRSSGRRTHAHAA